MMRRCSEEIKMLRKQVSELATKAEAYDAMVSILNLMPRRSQGMTEDLVWLLERKAKRLEDEKQPPSAAEQTADQ